MILLYHNLVPPGAPAGYRLASLTLRAEIFDQHMRWLVQHFRVLPMHEYLAAHQKDQGARRKTIAITFDDGTATSFECAFPILRHWEVPATIFVTTCHLEDGELMWGAYLNAVFYEDIYPVINVGDHIFKLDTPIKRKEAKRAVHQMAQTSGNPVLFAHRLAMDYPLPTNIRRVYQGMSFEQIRFAAQSGLIEIGAHTVTHPLLGRLPVAIQAQEIRDSRIILADITGKPVRYFAYPSGDYSPETLRLTKSFGFEAAFATIPHRLGEDPLFEIERVGIYSSSLLKLHLKVIGIAEIGRRLGLPIG